MKALTSFAFLFAAVVAFAEPPSQAQTSPTVPRIPDANPELLQLVIQDQWDRGMDMFGGRQVQKPEELDWKRIEVRDGERHAAVRKLLAEGKVKSGTDCWFGALIFQHSSSPEDLMLAHVLAATAATTGNTNGKWLAAASLDRYLWQIEQPQVFGTQFQKGADGRWTMAP